MFGLLRLACPGLIRGGACQDELTSEADSGPSCDADSRVCEHESWAAIRMRIVGVRNGPSGQVTKQVRVIRYDIAPVSRITTAKLIAW